MCPCVHAHMGVYTQRSRHVLQDRTTCTCIGVGLLLYSEEAHGLVSLYYFKATISSYTSVQSLEVPAIYVVFHGQARCRPPDSGCCLPLAPASLLLALPNSHPEHFPPHHSRSSPHQPCLLQSAWVGNQLWDV